jgi:WXG100 family type VII secretion target
MPTRFMTDPHEMRSMAGRFDVHAQTVEDEARKMWASSQNIAGAGWSGTAQMTSYDTMGQINTAFRNHEVPAARLPVKAVAAGLRSATHRLFC